MCLVLCAMCMALTVYYYFFLNFNYYFILNKNGEIPVFFWVDGFAIISVYVQGRGGGGNGLMMMITPSLFFSGLIFILLSFREMEKKKERRVCRCKRCRSEHANFLLSNFSLFLSLSPKTVTLCVPHTVCAD